MQGYILRVQKIKDEDCLVYILTNNQLIKAYRFYGARHPVITQGFKLDFEIVENQNFLPHLRGTMHLGFKWLFERDRLAVWQNFMRLLYDHLKGVENLESFYFSLLDECAIKFSKQNPKRIVIEAYLKILDYEGRLHNENLCFICNKILDDKISLVRGFLPACPNCINKNLFENSTIQTMLNTQKCAHINDAEINKIYYIVLEGL